MAGAILAAAATAAGSALGGTILANLGASLVLGAAANAIEKKKASRDKFQSSARTSMTIEPITSRKLILGRARVSGPVTYARSSQNNQFLDLVVTLAGAPVDGLESYWIAGEKVVVVSNEVHTPPYYPQVALYFGDGTANGDISMLYAMQQNTGGHWGPNHKQRGCPKLGARLAFDSGVFGSGIPQLAAVLRGHRYYDPRDPNQDFDDWKSWKYSANAALAAAYYLAGYHVSDTGKRIVSGWGFEQRRVDWGSVAAAANVCDEQVDDGIGGKESRYECHGVVDLDDDHGPNLQRIMTACGGESVYSGGTWKIYPAAYRPAVTSIGLGDLDGTATIQAGISKSEKFNGVQCTHISEAKGWIESDTPSYQSPAAVEADGKEIWKPAFFPYTLSPGCVQRLGKIDVLRARQEWSLNLPCKLRKLKVQPGDRIRFNSDVIGASDKPFRVSKWKMAWRSENVIGVDLTCREEAPEIYDESADDITQEDPAPDTTLPDPTVVAPPKNVSVSEELYKGRNGGGLKVKARVSWSASPDGFLAYYQPDYRLKGTTSWISLGQRDTQEAEALDLLPGTYDFRVRAVNRLGVYSPAVSLLGRQIAGLSAPPADVTEFTLSAQSGLAITRWAKHPDLDVQQGGSIQIRHSPDTSGATWASSTSIGESVPGSVTQAILSLKSGSYLAKAVDSSGNLSEGTAVVTTELVAVLVYTAASTVTEQPSFSGAKTNTAVDSGVLSLGGLGSFDDVTDVDALADWDTAGGLADAGTYDFANGIDLGTKKRVRLQGLLKATAELIDDDIDLRHGNVDDWVSWDGTEAADVDAQIWVRWTDDDPTSSPVWSDWQRLDVSEFFARAFSFQARLCTKDISYNINVSELSVTSEELA